MGLTNPFHNDDHPPATRPYVRPKTRTPGVALPAIPHRMKVAIEENKSAHAANNQGDARSDRAPRETRPKTEAPVRYESR